MQTLPPKISKTQSVAVRAGGFVIFVPFLMVALVYVAAPNLVIVFNLSAVPDRARIPTAIGGLGLSLLGAWLLMRHWRQYWQAMFQQALSWWIEYITGYHPEND